MAEASAAIRDAIYKLGSDASDYTQNMGEADAANEKLLASTTLVTERTEQFSKVAFTTADSISRLEARVDASVGAEQRREASLRQVSQALEEGTISQDRAGQMVLKVNSYYDGLIDRANRSKAANLGLAEAVNEVTGKLSTIPAVVQKSTSSLINPIQQGTIAYANFGRVVGSISPLLGLTATGGFGLLTKNIYESTSALVDHADTLRLNIEQYQAYRFGAGQAGLEAEKFDRGIDKLSQTLGQASAGSKSAMDTFKKWEIAVGPGRDVANVLGQVADRIKSIRDPALQSAAAADFFGERLGQRFILLLRGGSDALEEWERRARGAGAVMKEELAEKAKAANDELQAMGTIISTQLKSAIIDILPSARQLAGLFELIGNGQKYFNVIQEGFKPFAERSQERLRMVDIPNLRQQLSDMEDQGAYGGAVYNDRRRLLTSLEEKLKADQQRDYLLALPAVKPRGKTSSGGFQPHDISEAKHALEDYLQSLERENQLLQLNGLERSRQKALFEAEAAARRDGKALTDQQRESVLALVDANYQLTEAEKEQAKHLQEMKQMTSQLGSIGTNALEDMAFSGKRLGDAFNDADKELAKLITRFMVLKPLMDSLSNWFDSSGGWGGIGDSIGDFLFGGDSLENDMADNFFNPDMDFGQLPSFDVGTPFVNQTGPAMLHYGERVLTAQENAAMSSGGGGGPEINVYIENNFALGVQDTVRAEMLAFTPAIIAQTKSAVADQVRRGGSYARSFGS
jgi:hypothetical protein